MMSTGTDSLICIPVTETGAEAFLNTARAAAQAADAVELRLDYLDEGDCSIVRRALPDLARTISNPLILTFRPREQGGMRDLSLSERQIFWGAALKEMGDLMAFADLELDLVESSIPGPVPWGKVICSYHDF